jgi:hypothetical protein
VKSKKATTAEELQGYFIIHVWPQDLIEENARDRELDDDERKAMIAHGFIDEDGKITDYGWHRLAIDSRLLEDNSMKWLRATFVSAHDQGHDGDDLAGIFYWAPSDRKQVETLDIALRERIDMTDLSYGDLAENVWKGVSGFGQGLLGGQIQFEGVDKDLVEELADKLPKKKRRSSRK